MVSESDKCACIASAENVLLLKVVLGGKDCTFLNAYLFFAFT